MIETISKKKIKYLALFGLLFASIIWGGAYVAVMSSLDMIPPLYVMAIRFTIALIGLSVIFYKRIMKMTKRDLLAGLILGILMFLSYIFQTYGLKYTTASKNAFLTTSYVIMVPFFNWIINKKKADSYSIFAAILAILGIGLLSLQGDMTINLGDLLTLICGIFFALHLIYIDRFTVKSDPIILTVLQIGIAGLLSWICAPIVDGALPVITDSQAMSELTISLLYLGIASTMIGFLLQNVGQKYTDPSTAALILSLESVFGVLFSVLLLGEVLSVKMANGCILIFVAIIISETKLEFLQGRRLKKNEDETITLEE
ncbi:MAG: DMT family transporter [Clostridiales bacterium]|nr:DMT family transporter [Clostridiales bacterium]